ncbi:MAG: LysR substrate-binding domain-containing protein, partial [Rhodothermales bacterium]
PIGRQILVRARTVLEARDAIPAFLSEASGRVEGELRLGVIPTLAAYLLPLVTRPLLDAHPGIELSVHELTTEHILDFLASDRLDAGLVATDESSSGMRTTGVFREPFVAYVGPDHRFVAGSEINPTELSIDEIWLLSEGHCFRDQVFQVCEQDVRASANRTIRFESGSLETLCHLVDRVGGMTLLPYLATLYMDDAAAQRIRTFESPAPFRDVRMISRQGALRRALVDAATDVIAGVTHPLIMYDQP